jgi:hypothetical protein
MSGAANERAFLVFAPVKTPPIDVAVTDIKGITICNYSAPAGFQIERWCLMLKYVDLVESQHHENDYIVKCFDKNKTLIEIHTAKFKENYKQFTIRMINSTV